VAERIPRNLQTMSPEDGDGLGAPPSAAAHLLGPVDNSTTTASHQSHSLKPRGDEMTVSPAPDALLAATSVRSALTSAPDSSPSESATPDDSEAATTAPYGTRSRQRTGGSRPNYAEDKDTDMDTEMNGAHPKAATARKSGSLAESYPMESSWETPTRRGFSAVNGVTKSAAVDLQVPKDSIPGTSTFAANPTTSTTSKKRKQPGSNTTTASVSSHSVPTRPKGNGGANSKIQPETNMLTFERCGGHLNAHRQLKADDGTAISVNGKMHPWLNSSLANVSSFLDHAYFVCEPPGEPYYLARIMEFLHAKNDPTAPVELVRVNWYYRPKDIQRKVQDTRVVFASMHSDTCPLTSVRGKCQIQPLSEIANLDEYRVRKDSFWFDKLFDRYIHRYYEVIPTNRVINVPQHVKKVLDERWKFVLVEIGRGKDLTSAVKTCKKCAGYAAK
jgi:BAH domain